MTIILFRSYVKTTNITNTVTRKLVFFYNEYVESSCLRITSWKHLNHDRVDIRHESPKTHKRSPCVFGPGAHSFVGYKHDPDDAA